MFSLACIGDYHLALTRRRAADLYIGEAALVVLALLLPCHFFRFPVEFNAGSSLSPRRRRRRQRACRHDIEYRVSAGLRAFSLLQRRR